MKFHTLVHAHSADARPERSRDDASPEKRRAWEDAHIWHIFKFYSRTFSFAAKLLPSDMRLPVATLYFFCRTIDNIADDIEEGASRDDALCALKRARHDLDETLAGNPPDALLWRRLAEVHRRFTLHTPPLYELIDGAEWDLNGISIEDEDDLIRYSDLVAGSIGAMMLPFLVEQRQDLARLEAPARALGIAMQITNILRDVGDDARTLDRIYLPDALLARHGLSGRDLASPIDTPAYDALTEQLMEVAEDYYTRGIAGIADLRRSVRPCIRAAARIYREILNEIRRNEYDNITRRAYTSRARKIQLLVVDSYDVRKRRLRARARRRRHLPR